MVLVDVWHGGEVGVVGGPERGRREGEHRCGGAAYTDFADATDVWGSVRKTWGEGAGSLK